MDSLRPGGPLPADPPPEDLDRQLAALVQHSRRYVWATITLLGVLVIGLCAAVIYLLTSQHNQIIANQHVTDQRWCATLDLLTSKPVPKPAHPDNNPSRVASYQLYADFQKLRRDFGCR